MSRYAPKNKMKYREKGNYTIWIDKPEKLYKVTTDQGTFYHQCKNLDYKKTLENFKKYGFTNINIVYMGYKVWG